MHVPRDFLLRFLGLSIKKVSLLVEREIHKALFRRFESALLEVEEDDCARSARKRPVVKTS